MSILFYDDSPIFGGHEVMTLLGLESILINSETPVEFFASASNTKLCEKLKELSLRHPQLRLETLDFQSSKLEALRNLLNPSRCKQMAKRFLATRPSLVLAIQGNIEHSSLALHAARAAKIPSASYIPVPHSNAEMGARLGKARDLFCSHLFNAADCFITITDEMAKMLRQRGSKKPIHIVYNGVDTSRFKPGDKVHSREKLNLPANTFVAGVIGRIEFRQKQQNLLVEAVASNADLARRCHLVFAGDGPDAERLKELLGHHQLSGTVLPWSDPAILYPALDALIIPSRYEGLPLVMLEAISCGTAVLASDRDGMKDLLPQKWRFTPNDLHSLARTLSSYISEGQPAPDPALVAKVRNTMSLQSFGDSFSSTVLTLANIPVSHLQTQVDKPNI